MASNMISNFRQRNMMTKPNKTGYNIYDTFMSQVLPNIRNAMQRNRSYQDEGVDEERAFQSNEAQKGRDFTLQRDRLGEIAKMQQEQNRPMDVVFDRSQEISPKEQRAFELQKRGLDIRDENLADKLELDKLKVAETERKNKAGEGLNAQKIAIQKYKIDNPDVNIYEQPGGDAILLDKQGNIKGRIGPSGILTEEDKIEKQGEVTKEIEGVRQEGREDLAKQKAWGDPVMIADPNDGTKQIAVQVHKETGEVRPVMLAGKNTGEITKPGTRSKLVQPKNLEAVRASTQSTLDLINNEIFDKEGNLQPGVSRALGVSRAFGGAHIPFQQGVRGEATINQLKDKLVLDLIAEMKAQSRTGATGFGAMNLKELEVLHNSASKLSAKTMSEEDFINELLKIKGQLERILQDETAEGEPGPDGKPIVNAKSIQDLIAKAKADLARKPK